MKSDITASEEFYPMPMFVKVAVRDVRASADWYASVGFRCIFTMPGPDNTPAMVHLRRHRYQDLLLVSEPGTATAADPGLAATFEAHEEDLDALAAAARARGSGYVLGPVSQPWNCDELLLTDPDGHRVVFTKVRDHNRTQAQMLRDTRGRLD